MEIPIPFGSSNRGPLKVRRWHITIANVLAVIIIGLISLQMWGDNMGFPRLIVKERPGTLDFMASLDFGADLDNGVIGERLRAIFVDEEISLSDAAVVSTEEEGVRWTIADGENKYILRTGEESLRINDLKEKKFFLGDDIHSGIQSAFKWLTVEGDFIFDPIKGAVNNILESIEDGLLWLPWPVLVAGVALLGLRVAGVSVALFSAFALLLIGFVGLWESAMETMSLMLTAVVASVLIAIPIGILAARSNLVDAVVRPVLDLMQTMPAFVYLVPFVFFFSLGNVPAVFSTVMYAIPPAIRLTNLGIRQVSPEMIEAARAFGATRSQLLLKVQMPLALPTIMAGVNQTTMMALAMVVVASMVGAGGLGGDVFKAIGGLEVGNSFIAGMGIVFLAIIIDRISQGFARSSERAAQE